MAGWTADWPGGISRTDSGVTYNYIQAWEFVVQCWWALRQRHAVLAGYISPATQGLNAFPPPTPIWDRGLVDSITDNGDGTITVAMSGVSWPHTWFDYTLSGCSNAHIPSHYVLIIEPEPNVETLDPRLTVRGSITASTFDGTSAGTLTIARGSGQSLFPLDAVTANYITSLSTLVGQNWYIIQDEGWWCSERLPDRPDEQQLWVGDGSSGGNITVASHVVTVVAGSYSSDDLATLSVLPDGSYSTLTDPDATWSVDQWIASPAKDVLYYGSDSALHRDTITHNFGSILTFANHSGWTASGAYIIVPPGDIGYPGRNLTPIFQWYTGIGEGYKTHLADDSIGTWLLATLFTNISDGDNCGGTCGAVSVGVFDSSAQIDQFNDCEGTNAGLFLSPKYTKCLRSIQTDIINICSNFLPYADYTGVAHNGIPLWTPATFMLYVGINAFSCGYTYVDSSHLTISGAPSGVEYPHAVWFTITNADGSLLSDTGTMTDDATLTPDTISFSDTSPLPTAVTITLGFTRYRPRHVRHFYAKTGLVPTYDGGTFDPPTVDFDMSGNVIDHTGQWVRRDKSSTYKSRSATGVALDGPTAFVDGELATHVGDNAPDTCIYTSDGVPIDSASGSSTLDRVPYYDHWFRGKYDTTLEQRRLASTTGISTGGQNGSNNYALTDATQNWWSDGINGSFVSTASGTITAITEYSAGPPVAHGNATVTITVPDTAVSCDYVVTDATTHDVVLTGSSAVVGGSSTSTLINDLFLTAMVGDTVTMAFQGSLHVDSGTATSGSSTSLTDSAHVTTGSTNPLSCWWSGRFLGFSDPSAYTDFVLVISHSGNTWRVPITSTTSGSGGVTFNFEAVTGLTVASGYTWSLTEPAYEINKWEARTVSLVDPATKDIYQSIITHSDDNTIFFGQVYDSTGTATSVTLDSGWSYTIDDRRFGGVWLWDATGGLGGIGAWIKPTGDDVGRMGNAGEPQPFKDDQTMNLPTIVRDYGKIMVDDIMDVSIFTEIQTAINALKTTKISVACRDNAVDGVPELNSTSFHTSASLLYPAEVDTFADAHDFYVSLLATIWDTDEATADAEGGGAYGGGKLTADDTCPQKSCGFSDSENWTTSDGGTTWTLFQGFADMFGSATYAYMYGTIATLFSPSVDFYNYAQIDADDDDPSDTGVPLDTEVALQFDDGGDPVLFREWKKFSTNTPNSNGEVVSDKLGSLSPPADLSSEFVECEAHTNVVFSDGMGNEETADGYSKNRGYVVADKCGIVSWSFTYV